MRSGQPGTADVRSSAAALLPPASAHLVLHARGTRGEGAVGGLATSVPTPRWVPRQSELRTYLRELADAAR
ncbi:MAG: hypothetical protein U0Q19_01745 [Kineosporiaceae bacterium]